MPLLDSLSSPSLLRNHSLLKLLSFRIQVALAYQIIAVTAGWQIYELTHAVFALGLINARIIMMQVEIL